MKLLRIVILVLVLLSIPSFSLAYLSSTLGTVTSYLILVLLLAHFILDQKKGKPLLVFLFLGVSYYVISSFSYIGEEIGFLYNLIKFLIVIVCGADVIRKTTTKEIYYILLIGAFSVAINAIFLSNYNANFTETYGRYSGFYLNPNYAGSICLLGLSLSFQMKNNKLRLLGLLLCTVGGLFTLSRYFMIMWVLVNFISVFLNRKNAIGPAIGAGILILFFSFASLLQLKADRFGALESLFSDSKTVEVRGEGRASTWASYSDVLMDSPFIGNGYKKMHGNNFGVRAGVHNTYLMLLGEAGIVPFLICIFLYVFLMKKTFDSLRQNPGYFYFALILFTSLLVSHNYFDKFSILFLSMFLYIIVVEKKPSTSQIPEIEKQ